jgi:hypothetical protein
MMHTPTSGQHFGKVGLGAFNELHCLLIKSLLHYMTACAWAGKARQTAY